MSLAADSVPGEPNQHSEIRALVFDFDGLVVDTETPEFQAWQEIFADHGTVLELATWAGGIGTADHHFDPYAALDRASGRPVDRDALRTARRARIRELVSDQPVLPGVEDYLRQARDHGLRVGLASSSSRAWVHGHLAERGLLHHFDTIRTGDEVEHTKPDPALYRLATADLGVEPARAVALEDSPNGVAAAKRAGMFCVVVPNALTRQLDLAAADVRVGSLANLPLTQLLDTARKWSERSRRSRPGIA
ncbi:haloacid dehalogenase superfamily, subfamily IA, variant 3 with third motif having DD or ED [Actinopolymorpha cephalotaxi]|uniref:HAD superfamily hydrolase (TIGR01509 family) n=1 Tax=Actinopolymorpha cephalotaxi TaxID=504797 RepID=A0A1I2VYM8_9ACTN|nr:HAD family hydrolase [Actinopolymorpha cephalotaxi]NYH82837.1 HAD superfamily hydrolase (TIGR01509 family) [Actinopolymorpha cephalotaxi]SFG94250.1 haloacid dehalogenase superfamily, subfamily IA, variant 3 with third motif having DD or ED [Actinopolymorpha cephalotaxi]